MQKFCYPRKRSFTTSTLQGAHEAEKSLSAHRQGGDPGPPSAQRPCGHVTSPAGRPPSPRPAQGRARRREVERSSSRSGNGEQMGCVCLGGGGSTAQAAGVLGEYTRVRAVGL